MSATTKPADDFPFEDEPNEPRPCEYCGTTIVVENNGSEYEHPSDVRHHTSSCREYVHAALRATKGEIARLRAALETARYELRDYVKDDQGYTNRTVVDCIEEIDAALSHKAPESKGDE